MDIVEVEVAGQKIYIDCSKFSLADWAVLSAAEKSGDENQRVAILFHIVIKVLGDQANTIPFTLMPFLIPKVLDTLLQHVLKSNPLSEIAEILERMSEAPTEKD